MPLVVADRVRETTTTTGTGTITLAGAVTGYQSFSAIGNGNTTYYTINAGSQWEVGIGTYLGAGPTLSRDTVLESSNSGSLVNFSAGTKDVFVTYPAEKSISDGYGLLPVANGGTGQSSYTNGQLLIGNSTGNTLTKATLTAGTNISITNGSGAITINATDQYVGTVTSVNASGGTTGLTFSGGPITTSGTLTLAGTLGVPNGGTGATSLTSGYLVKGNGTSAVSASVVYDDGTNVGIGTSSFTNTVNNFVVRQSGTGIDLGGSASTAAIRVRGTSGGAGLIDFYPFRLTQMRLLIILAASSMITPATTCRFRQTPQNVCVSTAAATSGLERVHRVRSWMFKALLATKSGFALHHQSTTALGATPAPDTWTSTEARPATPGIPLAVLTANASASTAAAICWWGRRVQLADLGSPLGLLRQHLRVTTLLIYSKQLTRNLH